MAQTKAGAQKILAAKTGMPLEAFQARIAAGEKWCWKCRLWHPVSAFNIDRSRYDGRSAKCHGCSRVKVRVDRKGQVSAFRGKKHTPEAIAKMSIARTGKPGPRKGIPRSPEVRAKISAALRKNGARGPAHYAWKNGAKQRNLNDRRRPEYQAWREAVFKRDNYCCQKCGDKTGGNLRAHHIKSFAKHKTLRFDVENGITLCHDCHELEHYKPDSTRNLQKAKRGQKLIR